MEGEGSEQVKCVLSSSLCPAKYELLRSTWYLKQGPFGVSSRGFLRVRVHAHLSPVRVRADARNVTESVPVGAANYVCSRSDCCSAALCMGSNVICRTTLV